MLQNPVLRVLSRDPLRAWGVECGKEKKRISPARLEIPGERGITTPHWTSSTASPLRGTKVGGKEENRLIS